MKYTSFFNTIYICMYSAIIMSSLQLLNDICGLLMNKTKIKEQKDAKSVQSIYELRNKKHVLYKRFICKLTLQSFKEIILCILWIY